MNIFKNFRKNVTIPISVSTQDPISGMAEKNLSQLGLLHLANKKFNVKIKIENNELITIQLLGYQNPSDAFRLLRENGYLDSDKRYYFVNWPKTKALINWSAYACELGLKQIYYIESKKSRTGIPALLYGCPTPTAMEYDDIMSKLSFEVIDYGAQ